MPKVIIYSTPTCSFCHLAKEFFKEHNITFTDIDVSTDHEAARTMVAKTGQMGVPVIIVSNEDGSDEKITIGFDEDRLSSLLDIKS